MQKVGAEIQKLLATFDDHQAMLFKAAFVHRVFAEAILEEYGDNTAPFILQHVQAVYVQSDTDHLKKSFSEHPDVLLRVYTDEAIVRSDLDARQERLKFKMVRRGVYFDKLKSYASTFEMRKRKPYEDLLCEMQRQSLKMDGEAHEDSLGLVMSDEEIRQTAALAENEQLSEAIVAAMRAFSANPKR